MPQESRVTFCFSCLRPALALCLSPTRYVAQLRGYTWIICGSRALQRHSRHVYSEVNSTVFSGEFCPAICAQDGAVKSFLWWCGQGHSGTLSLERSASPFPCPLSDVGLMRFSFRWTPIRFVFPLLSLLHSCCLLAFSLNLFWMLF